MKHVLKVFLTVLVAINIVSCKQESPFWEPIKKDIISDALGADLGFKLIDLEVKDTVLVSESIKDWYLLNNDDSNTSNEECLKDVENLVGEMKDFFEQTGEPEDTNYIVWKNKLERIKELEAKSPNDVDYYVVFVYYQFKNELLDGALTHIYRYYMLSPQMEVTNKIDEDDFKDLEKEYNKTPLLKYEFWKLQDLLDL